MPQMVRTLGDFHQRVDRWLTGKQPRQEADGWWLYLPLEEAMLEAGTEIIKTYIAGRQSKIDQYIATCPMLELYLEAER